jgi:hypothetical protein
MRGLKSTILLLAVLVGLVAYIYFVDSKKPASGGTPAKDKAFAALDAGQIEEVQLKSESGETSRVQKTGETWKLVEPEAVEADSVALSTLTTTIAGLEVERVVDENPSDVKQYGLDPARVDVGFRVKGQKDFQHLLVGQKTPSGGDLYAKKPGEKRVFLIPSYHDTGLNRTPFDLRDKDVLKFERDKADGLEIIHAGDTRQFARTSSTEWKIVKPVAARADYAALEGEVTRISSLQMHKIVAPQAGDLKQYGLDKPDFTVSVSTGSARATVIIGKKGDDGLYAKDVSRPMIFTLEETITQDFAKDLDDFVRKEMFDARSFTTNRIEFRRGAETLAFEKSKAADGKEVWKNAAGKAVDSAKVEDLLAKVSNFRAMKFEPVRDPSLKMPVLTITVRFDENKMETVNFGKGGIDVFAARTDDPASAKMDAMLFDEMIKTLDTMK